MDSILPKHIIISAVLGVVSFTATAYNNPTPQRSYVSLKGADTNSCGATAPCRTWQVALAETQPGGEILTLDSGGFGMLAITKAVTLVVPPGVYGAMSPPAGNDGVVINAPGARVVLRGLTIKGQSVSSLVGINVLSAAEVIIEDSVIEGMTIGINATSAGGLTIAGTKVRANHSNGINLAPATGTLLTAVHGSEISVNGNDGITLGNNVHLDMKNSVISANGTTGTGWGVNVEGTVNPPGIGINAQNNTMATNASGGFTANDISGSSLGVVGYLEHNDISGGADCINVAGTAFASLAWNTLIDCGTGVVAASSNNVSSQGTGTNSILPAVHSTTIGGVVDAAIQKSGFW